MDAYALGLGGGSMVGGKVVVIVVVAVQILLLHNIGSSTDNPIIGTALYSIGSFARMEPTQTPTHLLHTRKHQQTNMLNVLEKMRKNRPD